MVIIITGLISAGKTTLARCLMNWGYKSVLEYTTRPMREGEQDGVDYHFIDDNAFDAMEKSGEFAETFHVDTIHGLWKYGARKEDLKDNTVLVCGPTQVYQILKSGISALTVLLDIDKDEAKFRAAKRGDNIHECERRFNKDKPDVDKIRNYVSLVLDACDPVEDNAKAVDRLRAKKTGQGYKRQVDGQPVITAQEMNEGELNMYLSGRDRLAPFLRMKDNGMPKNPIEQIAWLLLNGGGCGFCKVCRTEPCNIKDGERCTANIADYIRDAVHAEDKEEEKKND